MTEIFRPKRINVPGLLSDDALQEQLKQFASEKNIEQGAAPMPNSALEAADKIQNDYLAIPAKTLRRAATLPLGPLAPMVQGVMNVSERPVVDPQSQGSKMEVRSDAAASIVDAVTPDLISDIGTLSPDERQAEADKRLEQAKEEQKIAAFEQERRAKMRASPGFQDMIGDLGAPVGDMIKIESEAMQQAGRDKQAAERTKDMTEQQANKDLQPTQTWWMNMIQRGVASTAHTLLDTAAGAVIGGYELIPGRVFNGGDMTRSDMRAWIRTADMAVDKILPGDKARAKDFLTSLASGTGSMAAYWLAGYVTRMVGLPPSYATGPMSTLAGGAQQYEDAERFGAVGLQKYAAFLLGAANNATEMIPIDRMFMRADRATGGLVMRMLDNTKASTLENFVQDFQQAAGADVVAKWIYDAKREYNMSSYLEQGLVGGITGGVFGAATALLGASPAVNSQLKVNPELVKALDALSPEAQSTMLKRAFDEAQASIDELTPDYNDAPPAPDYEADKTALRQRVGDFFANPRVLTGEDRAIYQAIPEALRADVQEYHDLTNKVIKAQGKPDALSPEEAKRLTELGPRAKELNSLLDGLFPQAAAPSEQAAISQPAKIVQGPGGSIPVREDGMFEATHWSRKPLDVIDPAMRGTGSLRGEEQNRIGRVSLGDQPAGNIVDRSYAGVGDPDFREKWQATQAALPKDQRTGMKPTDPYHREGGLGGYRHTIALDPNTIYNWIEDPLKLKDQLDPTAPDNDRTTHYEKLIKDAGFAGAYISEKENMGQTVMLFDKVQPEKVIDEKFGLDPKEIASIDEFKQISPETFKKGGWAVVTGTQEAQGDPLSPANIEANKKLENVLKRNGIKYMVVGGAYDGADQGRSFLIFESEKRAMEIGKRFNQESVLTRDGYKYTDGRITPVDQSKTVVGPEALTRSGYSVMPDGTPFSLGLDFDATYNPDEIAAQYGIDDVMGMREDPALAPLPGLPEGSIGPVDRVVSAAKEYAASVGLPERRQAEYVQVDKERAKRIADAYEAMEHAPNDPAVKAAYRAMIDETLAQYQFVKASGLKIEFIAEGQPDPYTEGPKQVLDDLKRGHLWVFPTDSGFGSEGDNVEGNPLLEPTNEYIGDRQLLANDVFRIVHDFFGHGIEGSGFGARGEENAWQSHMRLYSDAALPAVTSETRGQNSWVNFGPHGEANRANPKETVYAPQKTGIMPEWTWREGVAADEGDLLGLRTAGEDVTDTQEFASWFKKSQVVDEFGLPLVVYHSTTYVEDTPTANPYSTTGFSEFNTQSQKHLGAHFGTVEQGATIVDYAGKPAHNSNVYPVYLSVQNPIRLRDEGSWTYSRLRGQLQSVLSSRQIDELDQYITNSDEQLALMREMIKNEGYDGVVYTNRYEGFEVPAGVYSGDTAPDRRNLSDADFAAKYGAQESWIIFEPNQVKSTMNNGDFDSSENDILAMVAKPSRIDKLMDQVPGLKRVAKHMLPDERAKLYKGNASTIVNIFENLPDPSEIASVAFAGRAKKGWYQRSAEALVDIFGIEDAPRFTALLAALSPQTSVENNAITALKVWTAWVRANRPPHADAIKRILAANVQGQNAEKSVLDAWINNSITSLSSPDPSTVVLSGPKVDSFMQNLRGVTNAVTNDAWMANYANIDQKVFAKSGEKAPGKGPGYVAFSARVRAAAALLSKRTGVEWTPAEIQETVWSWAKTLTEMAESKEETRSAVEIIEQSGLTAEQIAATPDFASLFAQGVYAEILKKGGYDVETAGSSGRSDVGDGRASDPASAEGSGVSQSTHDTNIRRAAQRLDALLAKRAEARAIAAEAKRLGKGKKVKGESGNRLAPESESDLDFTPMDQPGDTDPLAHLSEDDLKFIDEGGLLGQRSAPGPLPDVDLLPASRDRAAYKGELERPAQGIPMKPGDEKINAADKSAYAIAKNFTKLISQTVRLNRFTLKGSDVMGQYSTKQDVTRVRSLDDVDTIVHEGGHALQAAAQAKGGTALTSFINGHVQELHKVAADLYEGDLTGKSGAEKVAEGFAEFFRVFVLGRTFAEKKYPQLFADFNDMLAKDAPELHKGLEAVSIQHEAWAFELPSAKLVEGMIVSTKVHGPLNEALKDIREAGFGTWMHEVTRHAVERNINRSAPLRDLMAQLANKYEERTGKALDIKAADDFAKLYRLTSNSANRAHVQTVDGVLPYRETKVHATKGLAAVRALYHGLDENANVDRIDEERTLAFDAYVAALRGIDEFRRLGEGKISKMPLGRKIKLTDLQQTVKDYDRIYGPKFAEAAAIMHDYGMALWQKTYDAGLMSKETYDAGRARNFYVPLQRDMTDLHAGNTDGMNAKGGRSVVKKLEGSGRKIISPLEILQHKTFALEKAIAENEIALAMDALAERVGAAGALVERIPANRMVGMSYSVEEIAKALAKDKALSPNDAQDLMDVLDKSISENNILSLYRSKLAQTDGQNIVFFWKKGKVEALQLLDGDLGADIVQLMNGIGPENFHWAIEMVSASSAVFRASITSWPDFMAVNFFRDQWNAFSLTDVGYIPFVSGLKGVRDELRQRDWAKMYNASMGTMGGMNSAAAHDAMVKRDIDALNKRGYFAKAFSGKGFAGIVKGIASMVEVTETGTRLGVFKKAYERAKADGLTDWEASIEASYLATDLMDFGMNGSRMTMFRRTIPFLNAQIQGLYKLVRTLGGDEVRQRKGLAYVLKAYTKNINGLELSRAEKNVLKTGRKAWVKMVGLALVSAALHFIFEDDPDYQDASEYLRATGWVIPAGDGKIFYIPKPFELALMANFTERMLEGVGGDRAAKDRFLRGLALNLHLPMSPPLVMVAAEEAMNKRVYNGTDIVPMSEQGRSPELQYDEYTTDLAKKLGEITNLSPRRIDHVMSGLGASAYRDISTMVNGLNPDRPAMDWTEMPFFRRFFRDARRGSTTSRDFWKQAAAMSGLYDGAANTYKTLLDMKPDDREARAYLDTLDDDMRAFALLNTHFEADAKRFHPYYRGRQVAGIVSDLRRELIGTGLLDTSYVGAEKIQLSATVKAKIDDELSEYARRDMRNALVYMKAPGWDDKKPARMEETLGVIEAIDPRVAEELSRRLAKKKVIPSDVVAEYWPEVKDRLLSDGADAMLDDILLVGKLSQ